MADRGTWTVRERQGQKEKQIERERQTDRQRDKSM